MCGGSVIKLAHLRIKCQYFPNFPGENTAIFSSGSPSASVPSLWVVWLKESGCSHWFPSPHPRLSQPRCEAGLEIKLTRLRP